MTTLGIIAGLVGRGAGYGRELGFPTANLLATEAVVFPHGIYAGRATVDGQALKAAIVIGPRLPSGVPKIEAHLLGFQGNLYGKRVTLELRSYIRPWKSFTSEKALRAQIESDVENVERLVPSSAVSA